MRIRNGIEHYLWIQTVAGFIAVGSGAVMALLGLDNALFWAFAIFIVGYHPDHRRRGRHPLPRLFALVQFDGWWRAAAMLAGLQPDQLRASATSSTRACRAKA